MPQTFLVLAVAAYAAAPILLITGWVRWARRPQQTTPFSAVALAGFSMGTTSALLALGGSIYAHAIGGFPYYDPRLMCIYACGLLLSLAALVFSLIGLARPSPLRWHAPALSLSMLVIWMLAVASE